MFSSKLEIINHFDNLIQQVDIDIEECIEKYIQEQVLGDLNFLRTQKTYFKQKEMLKLTFFDDSSSKSSENYQRTDLDLFSESTKIVDYLNQVRMRTIDELRKAQEDTLEQYKRNKTSNNQQNDEEKSQTFSPDKFYFQVLFKPSNESNWIFNLFTFVTDFFISPIDINILENLINDATGNFKLFSQDSKIDFKIIFDEKMVLIGLLHKYFFENLLTEKFLSNLIRVSKQDVLNITEIKFAYHINGVNLTDSSSIDLSNLETLNLSFKYGCEEMINIEGLFSLQALHLKNFLPEKTSLHRLNSLRELSLIRPSNSTNLEHLSNLFEYLQNIEKLSISNELSYINLDSFVNLKSLSLNITSSRLNVDLFKNLSTQLEEINILSHYNTISYETIEKLFDGHKFPNLLNLTISMSEVNKFESRLFASFPMLRTLKLNFNQIQILDNDTFSNMKQLISLDLRSNHIESINKSHFSDLVNLTNLNLNNNRIEKIDEHVFSSLKNLQTLDLSRNQLKSLDPKSFTGLGNLTWLNLRDNKLSYFDLNILHYIRGIEEINLYGNPIVNKEEILKGFSGSMIFFYFDFS